MPAEDELLGGLSQLGTGGDLNSENFGAISGAGMPGALASANQPIDSEGAIRTLMSNRSMYPRDQIDEYTERALKLMPTEEDIAARQRAVQEGADARQSYYANPPIDRSLPWLGFSAGMLKPTRTGSMGESMGQGLSALQEGKMSQNAQELLAGRYGAEAAYQTPRDFLKDELDFEKRGIEAMKAQALIRRAEDTSRRGTPTMQESAWMTGNLHANPQEEAQFNAMNAQQKAAELARRKQTWLFRQGAAAGKNATALTDDSIPLATREAMARQMYGPLFQKAYDDASKDVPEDVYRGRPGGLQEMHAARLRRAFELLSNIPGPSWGGGQAPAAAPIPAPSPAAAPAPAPAAAAPAPAAGAPAFRTAAELAGDKSSAEAAHKADAELVTSYTPKMQGLNSTLGRLDRMEALANDEKMFNAKGAEIKADLSSIAQAFGLPVNVAKTANTEEYIAHVAELLKERLSSKDYGSGTGISNVDLLAAGRPLPEVMRTVQGKRQIIAALRKDSLRARTDMEAASQYFNQNRSLRGFVFPSTVERKKYEQAYAADKANIDATAKKYGISTLDVVQELERRRTQQ